MGGVRVRTSGYFCRWGCRRLFQSKSCSDLRLSLSLHLRFGLTVSLPALPKQDKDPQEDRVPHSTPGSLPHCPA